MNTEQHAIHDDQRLHVWKRVAIEGLTIRSAIDADAQGISALIYSQLHHRSPTPIGPASPEFLAGFAPETIRGYIGSSRYCYLVALIEGQLVGVLGIRDGQSILHLFVADSCQRRGIASTLWGRAKSDLLAAAHEINLVVNSSIYAIPVYERFGFKVVGPRIEGAGVTYVPMHLIISNDHSS
jgi:ribosomal protein S18 acetylase RimI-like enzyme